jgi:hypothetical protein
LKPKARIIWKRERGPRQMRKAAAKAARRRKGAAPPGSTAIAKGSAHERTA